MGKALTQQEFEERVKQYTNDTVKVISKYINRRTKVTIQCKTCGYTWEISPQSLCPNTTRQFNFIGCPECKYDIVKCDFCGKSFKRLKSRLITDNKTGKIFCSKECGNKYKNTFVTNYENAADYRRNAFLKYPHKCCICGYEEDERILEVHHLDENRNNNHIDNLRILCPNCHKKITLHLFSFEELMNK